MLLARAGHPTPSMPQWYAWRPTAMTSLLRNPGDLRIMAEAAESTSNSSWYGQAIPANA